MKTVFNIFFWSAAVVSLFSCKQDLGWRQPVGESTAVPQPLSDVRVKNLNGKAEISYTLPKDPNVLYVAAKYTMTNGQQAEVKSAYYSNTLTVAGFADTKDYPVALYTVSRAGIKSDPVSVTVTPLEAPIWQVLRSVKMVNAFGGYNLTAVNATRSDVSILVLKKNEFNEWAIDNNKSIYTNIDSVLSKVRALDTTEHMFPIVVRDRWGNTTDTVFNKVKPMFEAEFSKNLFRAFVLPGDAPQVTNGARLEYAWDNRLGWPYTSFTLQTTGGTGPHTISFDMGVTAKLSRIWIRPYPEGARYYFLSTMKRFEIWGSANPSLTGAFDNTWTLLGSYEVEKPSGLAYGTDNSLDQETAAAGFNWDIDLNAPKVRYIRIRCLENFAGGTAQSINELSVFGDNR
ncbi:DUF4959 domain-containing protein [Niabella sp. CC-SYL272]|uniref:DUF5000 domain-containing lipoprotein n=1 Tax=Niabella agricola TaxID=2891571 RepID=UPI001F27906B|nr:DUF5000 domain-containing lipoprotein [Niabella agricola]MCF3111772.1 DUF4959 domain-containing protein [Niabella agricola]